MSDVLQAIVRIYARAFVAQGIGIVGLLWCLFDNHPRIGLVLAGLVVLDQAIFLRGRFKGGEGDGSITRALDLWCLCVGLTDVLILFAVLFRATGLHMAGSAAPLSDPFDCLGFSLAAFARLGTDVAPSSGTGRLLAGVEALLGYGTLFAAGIAVLNALLARAFAALAAFYGPLPAAGGEVDAAEWDEEPRG